MAQIKLTEEERKVRHRASVAKWQQNNQEKKRAYNAEWFATNPAILREKHWRRYGIIDLTYGKYLAMCGQAGHVCQLCSKPNRRAGKIIGLDADHDRTTGLVRGVTCDHCNFTLGRFESYVRLPGRGVSKDFARRATVYLLNHSLRTSIQAERERIQQEAASAIAA